VHLTSNGRRLLLLDTKMLRCEQVTEENDEGECGEYSHARMQELASMCCWHCNINELAVTVLFGCDRTTLVAVAMSTLQAWDARHWWPSYIAMRELLGPNQVKSCLEYV
jgi:hypothetical protein